MRFKCCGAPLWASVTDVDVAAVSVRDARCGIEQEINEMSAMQQTFTKQLARNVEKARDLYRYTEHITLMKKKENRIDKALDRTRRRCRDG